MAEDYYKTLEVDKNADADTIKKAYKRLALKWHPDKNKSPEAEGMFKKVGEAYDVLSNPKKRQIYDQCGKDGLNGHHMPFEHANVFDIFNNIFGMRPFHEENQETHIIIIEQMTLKDVITGKKVNKTIQRKQIC